MPKDKGQHLLIMSRNVPPWRYDTLLLASHSVVRSRTKFQVCASKTVIKLIGAPQSPCSTVIHGHGVLYVHPSPLSFLLALRVPLYPPPPPPRNLHSPALDRRDVSPAQGGNLNTAALVWIEFY
jgi:hypothetical protein